MKGIRYTRTSVQVYARVGGEFKSKRFPLDTPEAKLIRARDRLAHGLPATVDKEPPGSFAEDARRYKKLVTYMPSYEDRAFHIDEWAHAFTGRSRAGITALEIRAVLEQWRTRKTRPLSPGSLNRRRTALMHLYTTLDGKSQPNIVKDVPLYDESASNQARAQSMLTCALVIRQTNYYGATRTILQTLHWTGWPASLLKRLKPSDLDTKRNRVRVPARHKGKGMPSEWVPVLPRAMFYLRHFLALSNYQTFSNSSIHSALAKAVTNENTRRKAHKLPPVAPLRPYDLRHSLGTWAAGIVKDNDALKALLRTNSIDRYIQAARAGRMEQARDALEVAMATRN